MPIKNVIPMLLILLFTSVISGCGSSSNGSEVKSNGSAYLTYPITPEIMTLEDSITLFGASNDSELITKIKVNGQAVSTEDNFKTWQVKLILDEAEDLPVTIAVTNKSTSEVSNSAGLIIKQRTVLPQTMGAFEYNAQTNQLYFFDTDVDLLHAWDLNTKRVSELNTFDNWDNTITSVTSMVIDEQGTFAYYADNNKNLNKLELSTGVSTAVSVNSDFTDTAFEFGSVRNLYIHAGNLIVFDTGDNKGLFNVDLESGSRTLLHSLSGVDVKASGYSSNANTFFIGGYNEILSYDVETDSRAVLSKNSEGDSVLFNGYVYKLAVIDEPEGGTQLLVPVLTNDEYYYVDVDINDGSRTKRIEQGDKALDINYVGSLTVDNENARLFIQDGDLNRVYQLDLDTMERTLVDGITVNTNNKTFSPQSQFNSSAFSHDGKSVFMLEEHEKSFYAFDTDLTNPIYFDVPDGFNTREHYLQSYSPETSQVFISELIEEDDVVIAENILVMNTQTQEMTVLIENRNAASIIFEPDSKKMYVAVEGDINISEFDLTDTNNISEATLSCDANENTEAVYEFLTMNSETGQIFTYDDEESAVWMWNIKTHDCEKLFLDDDIRIDEMGAFGGEYTLFDSAKNRLIFLAGNRVTIAAYNIDNDTFDVLVDDLTAGSVSKSYYDLGGVILDIDSERLFFSDERSASLESLHIPTGEYQIHLH